MFLEIYPFILGCPICGVEFLILVSSDPLYLCGISCNASSFIADFTFLSLLFSELV